LKLILCQGLPIFEQLQLEEALLRIGEGSYALLNTNSPPAIVLGISNRVPEAVCVSDVRLKDLPIIRRFSGGGSVVVDNATFFCTIILDQKEHPFPPNPQGMMIYVAKILEKAFLPFKMSIEAQDYILDDRKIGGNAQSFTKHRVLHHTSFLYSWQKEFMNLLKMPLVQPEYRRKRKHEDFLGSLDAYFFTKESFYNALQNVLINHFSPSICSYHQISSIVKKEHRRSVEMFLISKEASVGKWWSNQRGHWDG
jgi:lipoate---protein ligase